MLDLQLFIEGQQVELHDNESVTLTQTLQNVRDIKKIFTDFTQTFNIPASKVNNKIFKHFYNFNIVGFDARNKKDAELLLNHKSFKKGRVKLEGVQMANNEPVNYRLTFFGKAVNLKDLVGEDKLDALYMLGDFGIEYDVDNVISLMQTPKSVTTNGETFTDAILIPLITHTQRLYYDSTEDVQGSGNVYYGGIKAKGVKFEELKPALRVYAIVKAIERQYNIKFSDDFFNKTNEPFYNLYMWMHRKKGGVLEEGEAKREAQFTNFGSLAGKSNAYNGFNRLGFTNYNFNSRTVARDFKVRIETGSTTVYDFIVKKNGEEFFREDGVTGSQDFIEYSGDYSLRSGNDTYTFHVVTEDSATFKAIVYVRHRVKRLFGTSTEVGSAIATLTTTQDIDIIASNQVPEIKVIDFLTGLFKMFNLTAYQEDDTIVVTTLDSFYESSTNTFDITEYLDKSSSEVNAIMPYSEITFEYEGNESVFAAQHKEFTNLEWGTAHFNNKGIYEGSTYKVELPFEHHKFERILDAGSSNAQTDIQWGWSVDDNKDPYLGKPLLFYPHKVTSGTTLSVARTTSTQEGITTYYIPSNAIDPTTSSQSINFSAELSEYTGSIFRDSLFKTYYNTYITDTFNINRRLSKFKAYLPLKVLLNLKLQDKLIVFTNLYKINSLKTNFETGLSELELINEVKDFEIPVNVSDLAKTIDSDFATADTTLVTADNDIETI